MFDKLRKAFKKTVTSLRDKVGEKIQREIRESDIEEVLEELFFELVEADVAYEVAEEIVGSVKEFLIGRKVSRGTDLEQLVVEVIKDKLLQLLQLEAPDIIGEALKRRPGERPLVIIFLGVNGVGKTTTIAKIASLYKKNGVVPVIAVADTFRAGAQEQLKIHAERLGIPVITGRYGSDPASVAHDAISYAMARGYRVVLVDTAGRMHVDYDLMSELRKIVRVSKPDYKLLVVDSLTGNDAVEQSLRFNDSVGVDLVVLTKTDADVKGGTAVSIAGVIRKPIIYVGTGQGYDDIVKFDAERFVEELLK